MNKKKNQFTESQINFLNRIVDYGISNDNSEEALRERLYNARSKMLEEQEEIARIDRNNQLLRVMCFGRK